MRMNLHIPSYLLGVATAPAWIYVFRKPILHKLAYVLADDDLDESFYQFMAIRNDAKDAKKGEDE